MSKHSSYLIIIIFVMITYTFYWKNTPDSAEKKQHNAIFCNVIRKENAVLNEQDLLYSFQFYFNNSTPMYAYHKPKFYEKYGQHIIQNYSKLSPQQQNRAKSDFDICLSML
nr:hypothetical protein [Acinetobacter sp. Marseille-Q1620]